MDPRLQAAGLVETAKPANPYDHTYGTVEVPWYGSAITVNVIFDREDQDDQPTDQQIVAFCQFVSCRGKFFVDLEPALFRYFNEARRESDFDEEVTARLFPKIEDPRELKTLIRLTGLVVSYYDGEGWADYIGLLMECSWEEEHGLGVKIVDDEIVEIGFQDIVI